MSIALLLSPMTHPSAKPSLKQRLQQEFKQINWQTVWTGVARPIFAPILMFSLLSYFGRLHQILELTTHFRLQYLLGGLFVLLLYGLAKRKIEIVLCLFCISLNFVAIVPWYLPEVGYTQLSVINANKTRLENPIRVMVANVLTSNKRYSDFIQYVQQENPAVLVVMEMDEIWQKQLQPLKRMLPYAIEEPSADNFGIALFSKFPLEKAKLQYWGAGAYAVPSITANISVNQKPVSLIATHPLPPLKSDYFMYRNQHMVEMADYVKQLKNPTIVMGDLNMSMWSPYFRQFIKTTGMKSSRQGFGVQPSWPADAPLLQIPIDHCLVSRDNISLINNRIGKDIGSDHYPLIADVSLPSI
jgi:endonuclease/exonuclease/phosphatase (EEP) superfamily protein YafD